MPKCVADTLRDVQISSLKKSFQIESGYMNHRKESTGIENFGQSEHPRRTMLRQVSRLYKASTNAINFSLPKSGGFLP
jgi:hypothetical protein